MATNAINIKTIEENCTISDRDWPVSQFDYVEDLLYHILDTHEVKPVYRIIYGLKFVDEPSIWLATNTKVSELIQIFQEKHVKPELELRVRFRVTNLKLLSQFDRATFDILLRQVRHDFLYTRFSDEKRDFILVNNAVLGLISTDMAIYAKQNSICSAELFNLVNPKDFSPRAAAKWQRALISPLADKLNIRKSVETCMQSDLDNLKIGYLELFLQDVCPNYAAETYQVLCIDNPCNPQTMEIRIRYNDKLEDSTCTIEHRSSQKQTLDMIKLSDINTISYGTLRNDTVEINRSDGRPLRMKFRSDLESKSFLSLIEGYYRLMKKWHFNFCRAVASPELSHLKSIKCHGPIGQESSRIKLLKNKRVGAFLVRKCEKMSSRYIIDVIISSRAILSIEFQYNSRKGTFTRDLRKNDDTRAIEKINNNRTDANINIAHITQDEGVTKNEDKSDSQVLVQLLLNQEEYSSLKSLVEDVQIKIDKQKHPPLQLKHWLSPSEYDDYPLLLVATPRRKLIKLVDGLESSFKSVAHLPNIIPPNLLEFSPTELPYSNNMIQTRGAKLKGEGDVVVKGLFQLDFSTWCETRNIDLPKHYSIISSRYQEQNSLVKELPAPLIRLQDWLFVNNPLFVKSFGLCLVGYYLIQEYCPRGSLEIYLSSHHDVTEATRRSVTYQLAHALLFLQEQQIIHGKIRCHNIYITNFSLLQVKLSDPLGTIDCHKDRAFMPPLRECFPINGIISIDQYVTGIDVWAIGTTLWQIYSKGARPKAGQIATELLQPASCSDQIWSLIESCWVLDPSSRASPQSIFRDISNTFVWEKENHNYEYVFNPKDRVNQPTQNLNENLEQSTVKDGCFLERSHVSRESSHSYGSQANLLSLGSGTDVSNDYKMNTEAKKFSKPKKSSWKKYLFDKSNPQETISIRESNYTSMTSVSMNLPYEEEAEQTLVALEPKDQIDSSRLKLSSEIGRGASGVVFKGFMKGTSEDMVVAVKQIDSSCMSEVEDLKREFSILKSLDHDNILKTYGFVDEAKVMLVVEYMPLGSLLSYIKNSSRDHLITMPLKKYALDIARGMEYLESMKIVHRDLALRNILLRNLNQVKISDFGLAHSLGLNNHYKLKTERALPIRWYAPEALNTWTFTHKSDVWSYGIVIWEIYSGGSSPQYPGPLANLFETLKVERLMQPKDCPDSMYQLMLSCWAYDPKDRETFSNICDCLENLQLF